MIADTFNGSAELQPGDCVRLKSGGPQMSIDRIENDMAHVWWYVESLIYQDNLSREI